ncbi:hypothetical protein BDV96DRAFT_648170 [Lophiotrema nucula]|uniref:Uncharacterized protein n=1 Tax=Lophiotrema nucula TaxID=690887 RepID=A0A6A5Z433_9PLEO|nr:hypothetical protein BDV96DRAFT_648170 [Lophiotrema nucula]
MASSSDVHSKAVRKQAGVVAPLVAYASSSTALDFAIDAERVTASSVTTQAVASKEQDDEARGAQCKKQRGTTGMLADEVNDTPPETKILQTLILESNVKKECMADGLAKHRYSFAVKADVEALRGELIEYLLE